MANRNLDIIIRIRDAASKPISNVNSSMKKLKNSAQQVAASLGQTSNSAMTTRKAFERTSNSTDSIDKKFTQFNKTLFTTTAVFNAFGKLFTGTFQTIEKSAQTDRLVTQFESAIGPRSELTRHLSQFTDNFVDQFAVMEEGLSLSRMGVGKNLKDLAEISALATNAAKKMGKTSAEGIKEYFEFIKDGSITHLQHIGLINKSNLALIAQTAILGKGAGLMSGVALMHRNMALGQILLIEKAKDGLKGNEDLSDSLSKLKQGFDFLRLSIGAFVGKSLTSVLNKVTHFSLTLTGLYEKFVRGDKNLQFLTKAIVITTAAVTGLVAVFGVLRLSMIALGSLSFGIPRLILFAATLGFGFEKLEKSADGIITKLKLFGAFIKGTWQLITSFFEPENMAKGIGVMDKSIHDMLEKAGLLGLSEQFAKVGVVIKIAIQSITGYILELTEIIDEKLGRVFSKIKDFLTKDSKPWSRFWEDKDIGTKIKIWTGILVGFLGTAKGIQVVFSKLFNSLSKNFPLFDKFRNLLSKIPVIGGLFKSEITLKREKAAKDPSLKPIGTEDDPIWVRVKSGGLFGGGNSIEDATKVAAGVGIIGKIVGFLKKFSLVAAAFIEKALIKVFGPNSIVLKLFQKSLFLIIDLFSSKFGKSLLGILTRTISVLIAGIVPAMGIIVAGITGLAIGTIIDKIDEKLLSGKLGNVIQKLFSNTIGKITGEQIIEEKEALDRGEALTKERIAKQKELNKEKKEETKEAKKPKEEVKKIKKAEEESKKTGFGLAHTQLRSKTLVPHGRSLVLSDEKVNELINKLVPLSEDQLKSMKSEITPHRIRKIMPIESVLSKTLLKPTIPFIPSKIESGEELKSIVEEDKENIVIDQLIGPRLDFLRGKAKVPSPKPQINDMPLEGIKNRMAEVKDPVEQQTINQQKNKIIDQESKPVKDNIMQQQILLTLHNIDINTRPLKRTSAVKTGPNRPIVS